MGYETSLSETSDNDNQGREHTGLACTEVEDSCLRTPLDIAIQDCQTSLVSPI